MLVEGLAARELGADLDETPEVLLEPLPALSGYHLVPGEHLTWRKLYPGYLKIKDDHEFITTKRFFEYDKRKN